MDLAIQNRIRLCNTKYIVQKIGAKGVQGQAYLDLGRLHKAKGRSDQARGCFIEAAEILEECESEVFLKQANEALASL